MSLNTSLIVSGDSAGGERALKAIDQGFDRTEKSAKELAAACQTAKGAVDALGGTAGSAAGELNSAGEAASKMAADAQRSAAAAMTASAGIKDIGTTAGLARHHVMNLAFQAQDLGVQMMMAAQSGNPLQMMLMALMMQGSQIYGIMMQAGIGVKGLAAELARMIGLVTVSSDAVATAAAAEAAANRAVFASLAQRANSAATAASAELVLAETAVALATSATAAADAQKRLALANADVTKTSAEAAIANAALGAADADATAKGNAAIASRVVSISRLGVVATGVAVVLGVLFAAFKLFQSSVEKTDSAERYVATLGLTAKEAKKLTD
ncbi:MAG: hypothetical protein LCH93_04155, partial [Proteobacteria bacterium]|nr:hypothetical protein [Pseudomonadota bacterium]